MEILIVICLLVVIALLLSDKVIIMARPPGKELEVMDKADLPDVMGKAKTAPRQRVPEGDTESHRDHGKGERGSFDQEIGEKQNDVQIPQEELDDVFGQGPDLYEEEKEWEGLGVSGADTGFAMGVTFEELSAVGMLLQQDVLETSEKETAAGIVHKLQGTELFSLLEHSMEGASRKIAALLEESLGTVTHSGSSEMRKDDFREFDIGEFV